MKIKILLSVFFVLYIQHNLYAKGVDSHYSGGKPDIAFSVSDLRCERLENPVGIDDQKPAFGWKLTSGERDVEQVAYQIVVASSESKLDNPDLWNSGQIISGQNTFVPYQGRRLQSARKYFWKVKIWSNKNKGGTWSEPASFVTGLLDQGDWKGAQWIAFERLADSMKVFPGIHGSGDDLGNKAVQRAVIPCFRKGFTVTKKIKAAFVYACGLGQYVLYINGQRVDSSFLDPAWSDYTKRCYYNSYDVTDLVQQGRNAVASLVSTGFLYINRERYRKLVIAAGYPMLRLKMVIRYTDGTTAEITTDDSWKTNPSAITYSSIYGGEDFNANNSHKGWQSALFDDSNWKRPVVVPGPGGKMDAQEAYPVRVEGSFRPIHVDSINSKFRLYDFGQNISGIVRFSGNASRGYKIRIIPSELINKDGTPNQDASGKPYYWEYTFKGGGTETWQPMFSYYGFRYAGIEVFDPEGNPVNVDRIKISSISSLHTQYGAPQVGTFRCSDTLFNRIFQLIRWGISNNMSNVATDCPHREKLGWLEETHLIGNSIQYNYDIFQYYNKIAEDMQDAQLSDGLIPDIAPEYVEFLDGFRDSPEWGSAGILVPWYTFEWYGDTATLRNNYRMMKTYVEYLRRKSGDSSLLAYGLGDWFDLGPKEPGISQLTPLGVTATAFYFYDAKIVSKVATLLHENKDAEEYGLLASSIRNAFNQKYYDREKKVYATGSQTAFAIPLYFGLAPEKDRKDILANLVDSIVKNNYALTAGDIGFRYVIQALEEGGYNDVIYKMNNRDDVPGYGYQIKKGATALTESWQALRNVSNDHMMLGHLMEWFYSGLGGIRQQKGNTGYKHMLIEPQFIKGINWVDCSYRTMNGQVVVKWERTKNGLIKLMVDIPANSTAKLVVPGQTKDLGSGSYTFNIGVTE